LSSAVRRFPRDESFLGRLAGLALERDDDLAMEGGRILPAREAAPPLAALGAFRETSPFRVRRSGCQHLLKREGRVSKASLGGPTHCANTIHGAMCGDQGRHARRQSTPRPGRLGAWAIIST